MRKIAVILLAFVLSQTGFTREFHVSVHGSDDNDGSLSNPLRMISAAAQLAQPGDVITVHEGTYRERITPPRGGLSDSERIVYQAAEGEEVIIKGSEIVDSWQNFMGDVWKATIPNSFFGEVNPYKELIEGDWFTDKGRPHHTGAVYLNGKSLFETHLLERVLNPEPYPEARDKESSLFTWFCESDEKNTYIYANFHGKNPNEELVEINVRNSCFYPDKPGCNYITIRGFRLCQAATQWAAPTAEQIGLIGTHWSKGWIIENNVISDSRCSGITLGKDRKTGHNVWSNDPSKDGATHYNEVILRALKAGWSRESIGSHIVRNNTISNCGQTGICGSLGAVFSRIENNHIYDIWTKRQFTGAEMAGVKIHASIDMVIRNNRIHNAGRGIWMDWMAQGTRITGNLCYDNTTDDLFVEVNHGPFLVDNNLFLSEISLRDWSEGGAYAHNLLTGHIFNRPELNRSTPYHEAHSTELAGVTQIRGGDDRFYNNIMIGNGEIPDNIPQGNEKNSEGVRGFGLWVYNVREHSIHTGGNVYFNGAQPYYEEYTPLLLSDQKPEAKIVEEGENVFLHIFLNDDLKQAGASLVTTERLGQARIPKLRYENADGSPLVIDADYFGEKRDEDAPTPGPFEHLSQGSLKLRVW
ncbi:MAG: right-handed parallel beta-helix repeat-containing protein [Candidatus Omnitrophica bacterium]|nr:right-handed parallel beta-helix repeat-containing protein [Candidatus Omnitrophota bacterium]